MSASADELFFSTAIQYYIAGRAAAFAGLLPVVGNLLHHAVEMYLKGGLAKTRDLAALKRLGHGLPRVWKEFKAQFKKPALDQFDVVITALHAFEEVRYPDSILKKGMTASLSIMDCSFSGRAVKGAFPRPNYEICLEDVDKLVAAIFEAASMNPKAFTGGLKQSARKWLQEENAESTLTSE
jgi:hypothetical protein